MATTYRCLLTRDDQIAAFDGDGRNSLAVTCREGWLAQAVHELESSLEAQLGTRVFVLREAGTVDDTMVCVVEVLDAAWQPPGGRWVAVADAIESRRFEHDLAQVVGALDDDVGRRPWESPGWYCVAADWVRHMAIAAGLEPTGRVEHVKGAWRGSCVLRMSTDDGRLYFKAHPLNPPGEAAAIRLIGRRWPDNVPDVVESDPERGWILMRDWAGDSLLDAPPETQAQALQRFAEIQIDQIPSIGAWRDAGCPDRTLPWMAEGVSRWLSHIPAILVEVGVLRLAEQAGLRRLVEPVVELCGRLEQLELPSVSVHHEDLRDGNVIAGEGSFIFTDWSDVVLAHPFFSLQRYLDFIDPPEGAAGWDWRFTHPGDEMRRAVRDAYLNAWTSFDAPKRIREAFAISRMLSPLYDVMRFDVSLPLDVILQHPTAEEATIAHSVYERMLAAGPGVTGDLRLDRGEGIWPNGASSIRSRWFRRKRRGW